MNSRLKVDFLKFIYDTTLLTMSLFSSIAIIAKDMCESLNVISLWSCTIGNWMYRTHNSVSKLDSNNV